MAGRGGIETGCTTLARRLGQVAAAVHRLPAPAATVFASDPVRHRRVDRAARHRGWRSLPLPLEQIDGYLVELDTPPAVLHADLHADHVFVNGEVLTGIIDWGDALVGDPYLELPALHLDLATDVRLLDAFLDGYGWQVCDDFPAGP